MPEIVGWFAENPVRWVIPAVLLAAVVGTPVALWWERKHPSSFTRRPVVPSPERADEVALDVGEVRETGRLRTQAEWRDWRPGASEDAGRRTAERAVQEAARVNVLNRF